MRGQQRLPTMMSSGVLETKTEFAGREREERHSRVRDSSVKALGGEGLQGVTTVMVGKEKQCEMKP